MVVSLTAPVSSMDGVFSGLYILSAFFRALLEALPKNCSITSLHSSLVWYSTILAPNTSWMCSDSWLPRPL